MYFRFDLSIPDRIEKNNNVLQTIGADVVNPSTTLQVENDPSATVSVENAGIILYHNTLTCINCLGSIILQIVEGTPTLQRTPCESHRTTPLSKDGMCIVLSRQREMFDIAKAIEEAKPDSDSVTLHQVSQASKACSLHVS